MAEKLERKILFAIYGEFDKDGRVKDFKWFEDTESVTIFELVGIIDIAKSNVLRGEGVDELFEEVEDEEEIISLVRKAEEELKVPKVEDSYIG